MDELDAIDRAVHRAKVQVHRALRLVEDRRAPLRPGRQGRLLVDLPLIVEDRSPLWGSAWVGALNGDGDGDGDGEGGRDSGRELADPRERGLELGKVENLRVAARLLDGLELEAGQPFSFWLQVGPPVRARGFVAGRELREGCVIPGIGGGLCLLSNALYAAALRAGFEILERHAHSRRPPGSRAAANADATVAWNYVDLRFVAAQPWRLEVRLSADELIVQIRSERRRSRVPVVHDRRRIDDDDRRGDRRERAAPGPSWSGDDGRSCMSCDQPCAQARDPTGARAHPVVEGRRSWLVDAAWPEYVAYLEAHARRDDRLLQPVDGELLRVARYAWPRAGIGERIVFPAPTLLRSWRSRRLADQGPARQRALLDDERRLAAAMAARLEPRDVELVVAQNLVPHLQRLGALGGRRVTVLMQRLPLLELQAQLDEALARNPDSPTLGDFRADPALVEAEARALDDAVAIVTPHPAIAGCFPGKTTRIDWSRPGHAGVDRGARAPGPLRIWLPASTVGRKGAWELREALSQVADEIGPVQLWIRGRELEGEGFWSGSGIDPGLTIEHGTPPLRELDVVVLPAWVEHQPRALLQALSAGVPVICSTACGLDGLDGVRSLACGDVDGLREHLVALAPGRAASRIDGGGDDRRAKP